MGGLEKVHLKPIDPPFNAIACKALSHSQSTLKVYHALTTFAEQC